MSSLRRTNLGRRTCNASSQAYIRFNQTQEQFEERNRIERNRISQTRSLLTQDEREYANEVDMYRVRHNRNVESIRGITNSNIRARPETNIALNTHRAAFHYNRTMDYSTDHPVAIGSMSVVCPHCKALKLTKESPGLYCASGKVKLTPLIPPPEPLGSLVSGTNPHSKHQTETMQID